MNLCEAVREAVKIDGCVTISRCKGSLKIRPTNEKERCILSHWDGSNPSKTGWQPSADDFIRDDWEVVN